MALNKLADNNAAYPLTLNTLRVDGNFTSSNTATFYPGSASAVALIVRRTQVNATGDLQQWVSDTGAVLARMNADGEFSVGLTGATARMGGPTPVGSAVLVIAPPSAVYVGLVIRGFSAQTGDLLQFTNSAGTTLSRMDSSGNLILNATGTGSIQLADATITKVAGSGFQFNSGGTFSQAVAINSTLALKPIAYAANQSGGITMTDAGSNWTVGGIYMRSDGSGQPRFAFVAPQTALEGLTINGNQVGVNSATPGAMGLGSVAAQLAVNNYTAGGVGLVVRSAGSQTGNLQEWQDSAGTTNLASVSSTGLVTSRQLISTITTTAGTSSFTFSSIPQTFRALEVVYTCTTANGSAGNTTITFSGSTGTNYNYAYSSGITTSGTGTTLGASFGVGQAGIVIPGHPSSGSASYFRINNYTSTTGPKWGEFQGNLAYSASGLYFGAIAWSLTSTAVTSMTFTIAGTLTGHVVVASLYGVN